MPVCVCVCVCVCACMCVCMNNIIPFVKCQRAVNMYVMRAKYVPMHGGMTAQGLCIPLFSPQPQLCAWCMYQRCNDLLLGSRE